MEIFVVVFEICRCDLEAYWAVQSGLLLSQSVMPIERKQQERTGLLEKCQFPTYKHPSLRYNCPQQSGSRRWVGTIYGCQGESASFLFHDAQNKTSEIFPREVNTQKDWMKFIFGEVPKNFILTLVLCLAHFSEDRFL